MDDAASKAAREVVTLLSVILTLGTVVACEIGLDSLRQVWML